MPLISSVQPASRSSGMPPPLPGFPAPNANAGAWMRNRDIHLHARTVVQDGGFPKVHGSTPPSPVSSSAFFPNQTLSFASKKSGRIWQALPV